MIFLQTLELTFQLQATTTGKMEKNSSSIFRGMLGKLLKERACIVFGPCESCKYVTQCTYGRLFHPLSKYVAPQYEKVMKYLSPPFVIEAPSFPSGIWKKGETKSVKLKLFGHFAKKDLYEIIDLFYDIGKYGIGKERISFSIKTIWKETDGKKAIVATEQNINFDLLLMEERCWGQASVIEEGSETYLIQLETPLRIQKNSVIQKDLDAALFFQNIIRRVNYLTDLYGRLTEPFPLNTLPEYLSQIEMREKNISWGDFHRYSSRSQTEMNLGGIIGSFELHGKLNILLPFLLCGSYSHIGKQSVFGLGKYRVWKAI